MKRKYICLKLQWTVFSWLLFWLEKYINRCQGDKRSMYEWSFFLSFEQTYEDKYLKQTLSNCTGFSQIRFPLHAEGKTQN